MRCSNCGTEYEGKFCPECGTQAGVETPQATPQEQPQEACQQTAQAPAAKPPKKKKPFYLRWWFILLAVLVVVIIIGSLGGRKEKPENFSGTYKVDHIEYNGSDFTVEEMKSAGVDLSNAYLILNDNGKAYLGEEDFEECAWSKSDDAVTIGGDKFTIVNGTLCLEVDDCKMYFKKISDSQTIPDQKIPSQPNKDTDNKTPSEDTGTSESTDNNLVNGMRKDFVESMDSYEKFIDEYVAFMQKYQANPGDMGLLVDYANFMSEYTNMVEKFDKWESEDLNDAELAYYIEVQARVSQKLLGAIN